MNTTLLRTLLLGALFMPWPAGAQAQTTPSAIPSPTPQSPAQSLACDASEQQARRIRAQGYDIVFRLEPARIEVGKPFAVLLVVCDPSGPIAVDTLRVDAQMPEHRHGMNYTPILRKLGPGRFQAEGMVFHMPGRWQFMFDVRTAGRSERLVLDQAVR